MKKLSTMWASIVTPERANELQEIGESYLIPCRDWTAGITRRGITLTHKAGSKALVLTEQTAAWAWPLIKTGAVKIARLIRILSVKVGLGAKACGVLLARKTAAARTAGKKRAAERRAARKEAREKKAAITAARKAVQRQQAIDALAAQLLANQLADLVSGKNSVTVDVAGTQVTCYTIAGRLLILAGKRAYKVSAAELLGSIAKASAKTPKAQKTPRKTSNSRRSKKDGKSITGTSQAGNKTILDNLAEPYALPDGRVITCTGSGRAKRYKLDGMTIKKAVLLTLI